MSSWPRHKTIGPYIADSSQSNALAPHTHVPTHPSGSDPSWVKDSSSRRISRTKWTEIKSLKERVDNNDQGFKRTQVAMHNRASWSTLGSRGLSLSAKDTEGKNQEKSRKGGGDLHGHEILRAFLSQDEITPRKTKNFVRASGKSLRPAELVRAGSITVVQQTTVESDDSKKVAPTQQNVRMSKTTTPPNQVSGSCTSVDARNSRSSPQQAPAQRRKSLRSLLFRKSSESPGPASPLIQVLSAKFRDSAGGTSSCECAGKQSPLESSPARTGGFRLMGSSRRENSCPRSSDGSPSLSTHRTGSLRHGVFRSCQISSPNYSLDPGPRRITPDELREHNRIIRPNQCGDAHNTHDIWMVIKGLVYDISDYVDQHPGGRGVLKHIAGTDATRDFLDVHSGSSAIQDKLDEMYIGVYDCATREPAPPTSRNIFKRFSLRK
mmetsp:Transcript_1916/g.3461  ORF Transcript_1916/g.3461 Transcript_1916/m.3461 type:complete len:436 (-) Transcript_1916:158-1465(-)